MIVFEFDHETHNSDGSLKPRLMYWLGCTSVIGKDEEHIDEIYEQLDAELAFL
jgi:hypothetical protein